MDWLMGDLQGCDGAFERLLDRIGFSASRDRLYLLGDLVGRGFDALGVLRRAIALGAEPVLGNHDLHLLAVAAGVRRAKPLDRLDSVLTAPDRSELLDWLRRAPLVRQAGHWVLVHAGLLPQWTCAQALQLSAEVQTLLSDPVALADFWPHMYGNEPRCWDPTLAGADRWRTIINACTRLRFVDAAGRMDFDLKESADAAPPGLIPWFEHPQRASQGQSIAFGHWSTLGLIQRPKLLGLDTGCVWGGCLTAARIDGATPEVVQVRCEAAQTPGT
ncbi:symmetrical bis(5'-nucleosyl)-tetraphosphatase [Inhella gelatinilytica]|uniref:bis(5'-nucleosyl)-tetraphosphatase (symmetrical) n=1 Tax=Inhella gelatinilytica TaxID=2795030 RepID=A0A931J2F4_9BURK|nr:symmetrical bis(5'-nucleosyl)-tetraphosphatase [Inhella gelatinilytica]MBH9554243.1 symmetrical bis(5'-nucleosyl)-tetraphosphatase [Inhella gelatinilytica]